MVKTYAIRCHISRIKCNKMDFGHYRELTVLLQTPYLHLRSLLLTGGGRVGKEGWEGCKGMRGKGWQGRGGCEQRTVEGGKGKEIKRKEAEKGTPCVSSNFSNNKLWFSCSFSFNCLFRYSLYTVFAKFVSMLLGFTFSIFIRCSFSYFHNRLTEGTVPDNILHSCWK